MIQVRELTKRYGGTVALDGLSFEVEPGKVTGFLGPNGAGKSTTMRVLLGLDRPERGEALIAGRRYAELSDPLRRVGALLEARAVHGGRRMYDHLWYLAQTNRIPKARVAEVIDLVGLDTVARKRAKAASLGMGQRLGLAAALLGDPEVLVLDEPVNGLDPDGVAWLRNLLKRLAGEGRTVLLSSHLMAEMAITAERLVVIGRGRLLADTDTDSFIAANARSYVRVRTPQPAAMRQALADAGIAIEAGPDGSIHAPGADPGVIGRLAADNGIVLDELSSAAASLEEAFMALTAKAVEYRSASGGSKDPAPKEPR